MKKCIYALVLTLLLSGCTSSQGEENDLERAGKVSFQTLVEDIDLELSAAKSGKYENLNITFDDIRLPDNELIQSVKFLANEYYKGKTVKEKLDLYKDEIFPKLFDLESVDEENIVDLDTRVVVDSRLSGYEHSYDEILENLDQYDENFRIGYFNKEKHQYMYTSPEGICVYITKGVMGTRTGGYSTFETSDYEVVKEYNCYIDDLSDSYLLMDGKKTVIEAKEEIESYLDSHYPLVGEDNGVRNEVYRIVVKKLPDSDYHVFNAYRTLNYNGIRVKEETTTRLPSEEGVMGEAMLCESNNVDITIGFINGLSSGTVMKTYEEFIPFPEVMARLSYYLTGDTIFDISYIGLEYRMFLEVKDDGRYYNWIPYWSFLAKNPNDDSVIRIYMDIETGEMESYAI